MPLPGTKPLDLHQF